MFCGVFIRSLLAERGFDPGGYVVEKGLRLETDYTDREAL